MKMRGKNFFKKDVEPNYSLRKLTLTFSVLVVVLGGVLVYRSIQAGELQAAFFPSENMAASVQQNLNGPKIEVTKDNSSLSTTSNGTTQDTTAKDSSTNSNSNSGSGSNYFLNYAMERDSIRAQQVELLTNLMNNTNSDAETKKTAQNKILAITDALEDELLLTNLLNAKYNTETAVFVQQKEVNVVIKGAQNSLSQKDVEKIAQIVDSQTGVGYENVVIVLKN